jgi:hypothetical protein
MLFRRKHGKVANAISNRAFFHSTLPPSTLHLGIFSNIATVNALQKAIGQS